MPQHVFVETNWVVDYVAPVLARGTGAADLFNEAQAGRVVLHIPAIALVETRKVLRERNLRDDLAAIRAFTRDARERGDIVAARADATFDTLTQFETWVSRQRAEAPTKIEALRRQANVDVFPLDEAMLEHSTQLSATGVELQSFDIAILAAVLVRARTLVRDGHPICFSTLDTHLQPWDKAAIPKLQLKALYDAARVWVYGDFLLANPPRPDVWP